MTGVMLLLAKLRDKKSVCIYDMISRFALSHLELSLLVTLSRGWRYFSGQEVMLYFV